jgi:hypothetical protein
MKKTLREEEVDELTGEICTNYELHPDDLRDIYVLLKKLYAEEK